MELRSIRTVLALHCLAMVFACHAALAEDLTGILMVEIGGLKNATGNVYIAVYNSDSTWLSDETVLKKTVVIAEALDGDLVRTELQLPLGEYALSAYYDRDNDGELDTNLLGAPKEPIALSNNAVMKFGVSHYSEAKFNLGAEPIIQRISMQNF